MKPSERIDNLRHEFERLNPGLDLSLAWVAGICAYLDEQHKEKE